jgi:hypothetical protein
LLPVACAEDEAILKCCAYTAAVPERTCRNIEELEDQKKEVLRKHVKLYIRDGGMRAITMQERTASKLKGDEHVGYTDPYRNRSSSP